MSWLKKVEMHGSEYVVHGEYFDEHIQETLYCFYHTESGSDPHFSAQELKEYGVFEEVLSILEHYKTLQEQYKNNKEVSDNYNRIMDNTHLL